MGSEYKPDISTEFRRWASEVGTKRVSEVLGIPERTIRRKRRDVEEGKPLSGRARDAFVEWYDTHEPAPGDGGEEPCDAAIDERPVPKVAEGMEDPAAADRPGQNEASGSWSVDERAVREVVEGVEESEDAMSEGNSVKVDMSMEGEYLPDGDVAWDMSYSGTGEQPAEERVYWRDLYERMPGVVPPVAYVDEGDYFGEDEAEELRRWRLYRQILADDFSGGPLAWVPNRSQRLWYLKLRKLTLELELELISSRELTLPPKRVRYDSLVRRREIARRQAELAEIARAIRITGIRESVYAILAWPLRALISLLIRGKSGSS